MCENCEERSKARLPIAPFATSESEEETLKAELHKPMRVVHRPNYCRSIERSHRRHWLHDYKWVPADEDKLYACVATDGEGGSQRVLPVLHYGATIPSDALREGYVVSAAEASEAAEVLLFELKGTLVRVDSYYKDMPVPQLEADDVLVERVRNRRLL